MWKKHGGSGHIMPASLNNTYVSVSFNFSLKTFSSSAAVEIKNILYIPNS